MALLNKVNFAEFVGVTRPALDKAIRKGLVVLRTDGKLSTKAPLNIDYIIKHNNGKEKQPTSGQFKTRKEKLNATLIEKKKSSKKKTNKIKPKPKADKPKTSKEKKQTALEGNRFDAELKKTQLQALKLELETAQIRDSLISREIMQILLGKLFQIDRNEYLTLGAQLATEVAGIFGSTDNKKIAKVDKVIESRLYKILKHKQKLIKVFMKEIKGKDVVGDVITPVRK